MRSTLFVHEPQLRYISERRWTPRKDRPHAEGASIYNWFTNQQVRMADYILVLCHDPKEPPPYLYWFYKCRTEHGDVSLIKRHPDFKEILSLCRSSKIETMANEHLPTLNGRKSYSTALKIGSEADLVALRMLSS